jgi:hypothetical protein
MSANLLTLNVPFIFQALITKPRCIKPVLVDVKDSVEITINKTVGFQLPVGIQIVSEMSTTDLHFDGENLWSVYGTSEARVPSREVRIDEIIENTHNEQNYKTSCASAKAPFKNIWCQFTDTMKSRHNIGSSKIKTTLSDDVPTLEEITYRELNDDNREAMIEFIKETASNIHIHNDVLMRKTSEPVYQTIAFGMGDNQGSSDLCITNVDAYGLTNKDWFGAHELEKAVKHTENVAIQRGDDESVPVEVTTTINIIMADAIKAKRFVNTPNAA